jgi:hypothetical protein
LEGEGRAVPVCGAGTRRDTVPVTGAMGQYQGAGRRAARGTRRQKNRGEQHGMSAVCCSREREGHSAATPVHVHIARTVTHYARLSAAPPAPACARTPLQSVESRTVIEIAARSCPLPVLCSPLRLLLSAVPFRPRAIDGYFRYKSAKQASIAPHRSAHRSDARGKGTSEDAGCSPSKAQWAELRACGFGRRSLMTNATKHAAATAQRAAYDAHAGVLQCALVCGSFVCAP